MSGFTVFRHGVTSELLESGTPIHVVTHPMHHGDSQVTLNHYAHILGNAERVASERLSSKIEAQLEPIGVIRRELGIESLGSTPTRFRQVQCFQAVLESEMESTSLRC